MRSDFVANVSHELRTPVTIVCGFAETLLELELDEATRREHLESILRSSRSMQRIIDDLLTLATLEADLDQPRDQIIDLRELFSTMIEEATAFSGGRHRISMTINDAYQVRGDAGELESAIRNLLTNAVRYTPDGGEIKLSWRVRDGEGWITVRDTGIGIDADHLPRLSERFYRVDRGRSRSTGGTGLGLAIVKRIASRHGAGLHIVSNPGEGSSFSLRLPASRILPPGDENSAPASA
jgi:two-component system phosphate regulon sensor histidine kinase PhoR